MGLVFKVPARIGEGTRVRREANYQAVGGEARRHQNKAHVSKSRAEKNIKGVSKNAKKTVQAFTLRAPSKRQEAEDTAALVSNDYTDEDLPEPGGHPTKFQARAQTLSISALQQQAARLAESVPSPGIEPVEQGQLSPEKLDDIFSKKVAIPRQSKTVEERKEKLSKLRFRVPSLRTKRSLEDEQAEATQGANYANASAGSAGPNQGSSAERGSETKATVAKVDGEEQCQLSLFDIDASKMDPKLYETAYERRAKRKQLPVIQDAQTKTDSAAALTVSEGLFSPASELERGITKYNERQAHDVAMLLGGLPGVVCNSCPAFEACSEAKENATCAFDEDFQALPSRDVENLVPTMEVFAEMQKQRAMRAAFLERVVSGGQLDPNVTRQIEIAAAAVERVARIKMPQNAANSRNVTVVQQGGNPQGGILSRLLAGVTGTLPQSPGTIELNPAPETTVVSITETSTPALPQRSEDAIHAHAQIEKHIS